MKHYQTMTRRTLMAADPTTRQLTAAERALLTHISRFGSAGYPVHKVGSHHWTWDPSGRVYPTKREAVMSFEAYCEVLRDLAGVEAYREAVR